MSLAPERISIKRRRQEEPVETLYLEQSTAPDRKRRVTDFYFQRVQERVIAPLSQLNAAPQQARPASSGIPSVRSSAPGDNVRDYARLKEAWKAKTEEGVPTRQGGLNQKPAAAQNVGQRSVSSRSAGDNSIQQARRFHLTRYLSSRPGPAASGGFSRREIDIRPPLATFVERHTASFKHERNPIYQSNPVDKVVDLHPDETEVSQVAVEAKTANLDVLQSSKRAPTKLFVIAETQSQRKGTSIQDHPSTWDHESDQLADELAALAMEFDPDIRSKAAELEANMARSPPPTVIPDHSDRMALDDNDFVYETYIRVQHDQGQTALVDINDWDTKIGFLVIEEDDEDLWNKYVDSDHDDDWDEEDSNAEDNPANDYPEDEVSSDDQFSRNPYKYRQYDSDNEYDDDYP